MKLVKLFTYDQSKKFNWSIIFSSLGIIFLSFFSTLVTCLIMYVQTKDIIDEQNLTTEAVPWYFGEYSALILFLLTMFLFISLHRAFLGSKTFLKLMIPFLALLFLIYYVKENIACWTGGGC